MAGEDSTAGGARAGGLLDSIKKLAATLAAVVQTRLQLFANEIHGEGLRLAQMLLLGVAAIFFLACGVLLLTFLVIVIYWDTNRLLAIGGFAVLYLAIGTGLALSARGRAAAGTRLFEASLGELKKDHDRLSE
jgi:uncharacterized membrane protein YqjE